MQHDLTRPLVRYYGGKWKLAPWIISFFPEHRVYVEPFGGGGSVLLRKERSYAEIYNDMDCEIVNLFRVARDCGDQLQKLILHTPFARDEFDLSFIPSDDSMEQARRTLIRSFMGFGSDSLFGKYKTGFRSNSNRSGTTPAHDWANYPDQFAAIVKRLRGVVIDNRAAIDVMKCHDSPTTLHYVDPPYVHTTRTRADVHAYRHEMNNGQHAELAAALKDLAGSVVLSGYACELYDKELFSDWHRYERPAFADGARERIEVIWINAACKDSLQREVVQEGLFA